MRPMTTLVCALSLLIGSLLALPTDARAGNERGRVGKPTRVILPASVRYDPRQTIQVTRQRTGKLTRYENPIGRSALGSGWREPTRAESRAIRKDLRTTLGRSRLPSLLQLAVRAESGKLRVRATPAGQRPRQAVDAEGFYSTKGGLRLLDQHDLLLRAGKPLRDQSAYQVRRVHTGGGTVGPIVP